MNAENKARVDYLFDQNLYDLPLERRPPGQRERTFRSSYNRLRPELPLPTITSGRGLSHGRLIHPTERRVISDAEAATAQEFPCDYQWNVEGVTVSAGRLRQWIGNAVPATLGHAVTWAALV